MSGKESLLEVLREQKAQSEVERAKDWDKVRTEWLASLADLRSKLETWLKPAIDEDLLTIEEREVEVSEHNLGTYRAPALRITAPSERHVDLEPRARIVIGGFGRVDLVSGPNRAMLILEDTGEWRIALRGVGHPQTQELTGDCFSELIGELLQ